MQISAFMSNSKCPELARRFADQVPQTLTEMMRRVDDFVKSEEAFNSTELPKGSSRKKATGHHTGDSDQHVQHKLGVRPRATFTTITTGEITTNHTGEGKQPGNSSTNGKIINMVYEAGQTQKRKFQKGCGENWMNAPITFPPISSDDISDETLIIKAEVEGYLVRRVFVDQGAVVQVMFEHCFRNLCPTIQACLTQAHTELVGFSREQLLPMGKIELEVMFGSERLRMRELRAISSTTHAMMKFPTPRGVATLVPRRAAIFECRQLEKNYHQDAILFGLSSPTDKFVKRQQRRVRLATIGYGRHPKTNKLAFPKRESKYHPSATEAKGPRPGKERGDNEGS
ncbi:hypothetical protein Tco_0773262 [Tanacetum coccineum]|uniref:Reverse transcriptase domain-containing protein n=1 Tax=Tanacetum coccineum TaxID=301880 RepID=A0ABQ4ZMF7_9ASTR